ncbi:hypothetical protein GCM10010129_76550 [Streptomyces fumigatiscleroticus]|nr:hypothetical protein GCM10010129_76550 [Streptomyces fumigatiscleroticus]
MPLPRSGPQPPTRGCGGCCTRGTPCDQGLEDDRSELTTRCAQLTDDQLRTACDRAGFPGAHSREESLGMLVLAQGQETPAALAFEGMAVRAAEREAGLLGEER